MIGRLCIIGTGLIGGSLARALREAGACGEIIGAGRNAGHLQQAVELGVIDAFTLDLGEVVATADILVICTPTLVAEDLLAKILPRAGADRSRDVRRGGPRSPPGPPKAPSWRGNGRCGWAPGRCGRRCGGSSPAPGVCGPRFRAG